jgi:hypothetical protein
VTNPDGSPNYLEIYSSRSTFMNLFDITNDYFLLSTESLTEEKIDNYTQLWVTTDLPKQVGWNNTKFDDIRKELLYLLKEMRKGKLMLDPSVEFRDGSEISSENTNMLKVPTTIPMRKSVVPTGGVPVNQNQETGQQSEKNSQEADFIRISVLPTIKGIFDELSTVVWMMKKSKNRSGMLGLAEKNLVTMVLMIMDYADRNPTKFRAKSRDKAAGVADLEEKEAPSEMFFGAMTHDGFERKSQSDAPSVSNNPSSVVQNENQRINFAAKRGLLGLKNIGGLKNNMNRRMAAKSYPESTDMVETGFAALY